MKLKKRVDKRNTLLNIFGLLFFIGALVTALYFVSNKITSQFPIQNIVFEGNKHLADDELMAMAGIQKSENLITISHKEVSQRLLKSPWIKSVNIRKEFPDTLSILIEETVPFALLDMNGRFLLIDERGEFLEELKSDPIPFLPIITGNPFNEREGFSETLNLAKTMNDMGFTSEREHIEILISKPQELTTIIDGTVVKVGSGDFTEKMKRLIELEEEIKRRKIPVDYIDVRFANRVVVKPIHEVVR